MALDLVQGLFFLTKKRFITFRFSQGLVKDYAGMLDFTVFPNLPVTCRDYKFSQGQVIRTFMFLKIFFRNA